MMSCPLGVTFWHGEQVDELFEGDARPPKARSSCARASLHQDMPSHHQTNQHHQTLALQA